MLNFCTLFDSNYLSRGLVMHQSLKENCSSFHLYIFAFDEQCLDILKTLNPANTTIISLKEFESDELLKVKPQRTRGEYCWTCTSSTILYVLNNFKANNCTYIDADMYFYSDPVALWKEMNDNDVLITPHRYNKEYRHWEALSGIYCVQYVTFKNNPNGLKILKWWTNACIEWCYARFEDGKFGDQKYLDNWPEKFKKVYVCNNIGAGAAPWNSLNYEITERENIKSVRDKISREETPLIFFHFHDVKLYDNDEVNLTNSYRINKNIRDKIYFPYIKKLIVSEEFIKSKFKINNPGARGKFKRSWRTPLSRLKLKLKGRLNVYNISEIQKK